MDTTSTLETKYEYRPLTRNNLDSVKSLHAELLPISYSDNFYQALLRGAYKLLLLYEKDKDILIGVSTWKIELRHPKQGGSRNIKIGYVATFGIRTSFRGRGLGAHLLRATLDTMRDARCCRSELHVLTTNVAAIALYLKCGYVQMKELPQHYHYDNRSHDALLFVKRLREEDEESESEHGDGRERSPPYAYPDEQDEVNVEVDEDAMAIDRPMLSDSAIPMSSWLETSVVATISKCIIL